MSGSVDDLLPGTFDAFAHATISDAGTADAFSMIYDRLHNIESVLGVLTPCERGELEWLRQRNALLGELVETLLEALCKSRANGRALCTKLLTTFKPLCESAVR